MYTLDKVEPVHLTHNSADISALFKRNTLAETRFSIKRVPPSGSRGDSEKFGAF